MSGSLRIAFAGTPEFALPALEALRATVHEIVGVWTQPDRPAGRGRKLRASPIKQYALSHALPLYQPATFKSVTAQTELAEVNADVMVVAAYGLLLPSAVLKLPRYGCINIHASLLPRWRGAAPIQRAILAGDQETGITLMQMSKQLDSGDILLVRKTVIHEDDTAQSLHDRLAVLGATAIVELLASIPGLKGTVQNETTATYAAKLTRSEARVDWTLPAAEIARRVRAFNPWPVVHTQWRGESLRIWAAQALSTTVTDMPGTVIGAGREGIDVATGTGLLRIHELQTAGRRRIAAVGFARNHALIGERFS